MNLNKRRAASHNTDPLINFKKSDVVSMLTEAGWELVKGPVVNKGEWNQFSDWTAVRGDKILQVARQRKGERLDWNQIGRELMDVLGDMTHDEFIEALNINGMKLEEGSDKYVMTGHGSVNRTQWGSNLRNQLAGLIRIQKLGAIK